MKKSTDLSTRKQKARTSRVRGSQYTAPLLCFVTLARSVERLDVKYFMSLLSRTKLRRKPAFGGQSTRATQCHPKNTRRMQHPSPSVGPVGTAASLQKKLQWYFQQHNPKNASRAVHFAYSQMAFSATAESIPPANPTRTWTRRGRHRSHRRGYQIWM